MKIKLLTILTIFVIIVIVTVSVLMFAITENNGLVIDEPQYINVYAQNKKFTKENKEYTEILRLYKNMTKLSYFEILTNKQSLNYKLTQDEECESGAWKAINKYNKHCIEMVFNKPQYKILNLNGNTKKIEFYSIIFIVEELSKPSIITIYFSESESLNYSVSGKSYPLWVRGKTDKLYNYIKNL